MKWLLASCILVGAGWSSADVVQKPLVLDPTKSNAVSSNALKHGRKLKGRFLQITDIHPDPFYKAYSSTEADGACHRGHGAAGYYGAETSDCDTPLTLVNATFAWIAEHLADSIDFVIWTGDSARHDNDEAIPRTEAQVLGQNNLLVNKFKEVFGVGEGDDRRGLSPFRIPIVPTFGNNDILPHNIFVKGPNRWTRYYQEVWRGIVPEAQRHAFDRGGWFFVEVIPNQLAVFSLNTIYFFDSNSAVDGCASKNEPGYEHMEWLRIQLQFLRERGMKAIMSGHVPPARNDEKVGWDETCWQKYTIWMQQYRDVVVGAVYGHMNIEHFVLQDFHDIDYDRAAGNRPSKSQERLYTSREDGFKIALNDAGYLQSLRRIWARLPEVPLTLGWNGENDPSGHVTQEEREYYDKIGGKYAERFAVSHMAASVVPNYFPALRVFEYNITGLENLVIPANSEAGLSLPSEELWYSEDTGEDDDMDITSSDDETTDEYTDLKFRDLARNFFTSSRPSTTRKKKKNHFIIPKPPSKRAPPGPAYSPQALSWLGYTQYYANLTHINNDFGPNPNISDQDAAETTLASRYNPLIHAPTSDDDIGILRWNGGKHAGKMPKHDKPRPLNFTYLVEYDTREQGDAYGLANGSTVRAWLELATRMGEFKPKKAKKDDMLWAEAGQTYDIDKEDRAEDVEDWSDEDEMVDVDDNDDVEVERKKKNHHHDDDSDKDKEKKRRKKMVERTWFAFASRAVVGTLTEDELQERFGME